MEEKNKKDGKVSRLFKDDGFIFFLFCVFFLLVVWPYFGLIKMAPLYLILGYFFSLMMLLLMVLIILVIVDKKQ